MPHQRTGTAQHDALKWQQEVGGGQTMTTCGTSNLTIYPVGHKTAVRPVACSWAQTPEACAEGRCRSPWKASGAGSLLPAVRSGWAAGRYLAAPRCRGPHALPRQGPGSRRLATGWGGACRSKPVSATSKPTEQIPLSTEGQRRDSPHYPAAQSALETETKWVPPPHPPTPPPGCGSQRSTPVLSNTSNWPMINCWQLQEAVKTAGS